MMHPLPDRWKFNGDVNNPTFEPSFDQGYVHWTGGIVDNLGTGERQQRQCHYIITDGKLQFCSNSWHKRSDIVAMPPIPPDLKD